MLLNVFFVFLSKDLIKIIFVWGFFLILKILYKSINIVLV